MLWQVDKLNGLVGKYQKDRRNMWRGDLPLQACEIWFQQYAKPLWSQVICCFHISCHMQQEIGEGGGDAAGS